MSCSKANNDYDGDEFEIYRGDDQCFLIEVIDDETEVPINISGWSFTTTFKVSRNHPDTHRTSLQIYTPRMFGEDANNGHYYLTIPGSKTHRLLPVRYFFDIQRELDGVVNTVMTGRMRVSPDITRKVI